jgi:hypothetical protein
LIDAVLQWNANVVCEGGKPTDAHAIDDILRSVERAPSVLCRFDARGQLVNVDNRLHNSPHHIEVAFVDVGKRYINVSELGNASTSVTSLRVNPTLPAPTIAIFSLGIVSASLDFS